MVYRYIRQSLGFAFCLSGIAALAAGPAAAETVMEAARLPAPIKVDGDPGDWASVPSHRVKLTGAGGVESVDISFGIHGDTIYVLAAWDDPTESRLHKPYRWNDEQQTYGRTEDLEDRLVVSFLMSGTFSHNKLSGAEFTADVWHWKASRSDPAGIAHDKMWRVSQTEFPKSAAFKGENGQTVYIARPSDEGDRLYRPVKYVVRQDDVMPRYEVNRTPTGSIADVKAKGVWRNGRWHLELARKLDTGHTDDAVIPASGEIPFAIAAFNEVDGERHSISGTLILRTGGYGN